MSASPDPKFAELTAKLEAASGGSYALDGEIALAFGWTLEDGGWRAVGNFFGDGLRKTRYAVTLPPYTSSVDYAMLLLPDEGCYFVMASYPERRGGAITRICSAYTPPGPNMMSLGGYASTFPLAICAAALKAKAALP